MSGAVYIAMDRLKQVINLEEFNNLKCQFGLEAAGCCIVRLYPQRAMFDVSRQDYIRTAKAKGLKQQYHHLSPRFKERTLTLVITAIAVHLVASAVGGIPFVEYVFDYNGLGKTTVNASLEMSDFPAVMGSLFYLSLYFLW